MVAQAVPHLSRHRPVSSGLELVAECEEGREEWMRVLLRAHATLAGSLFSTLGAGALARRQSSGRCITCLCSRVLSQGMRSHAVLVAGWQPRWGGEGGCLFLKVRH